MKHSAATSTIFDQGQTVVRLLQQTHGLELVGETQCAHQQNRRRARRHGGHQEQNGQQGVVPQRERLAHAQQSARVHGDAHREYDARDFQPCGNALFQEIEQQHDQCDYHEGRQEHNTPGHDRERIVQQQCEAQRVMQAGFGVDHQQHQTDHHHDRRDDMARLAHVGGLGVTPSAGTPTSRTHRRPNRQGTGTRRWERPR